MNLHSAKSHVFTKLLFIVIALSLIFTLSAQFAGGSGTEADPWQIATAEQLSNVRDYVGPDHADKYFIQTAHIDLGAAPWNEEEGWVPIGLGTVDSFRGYFDGNGYEIRNLTINRQTGWNGLFGLTVSATLDNISLVGANLTVLANAAVLAGYAELTLVKNCSADETSSVTGATTGTNRYTAGLVGYALNTNVTGCYSGANIIGRERSGNLVGWLNASHITNSYATGNVNSFTVAGGLVGLLQTWGPGQGPSSIRNSYATGNVGVTGGNQTGGLVGTISGAATIQNCYATGFITGTGGGLIGQGGTVTNCYWDTETTGRPTSAGGAGAMGRTTSEMTYPYAENTFVDWDFEEIWTDDVAGTINNGYPIFFYQIKEDDGEEPDETASHDIIAGDDVISPPFGNTKVTLGFENVATGGNVTVNFYLSQPENAQFPLGAPANVSKYYWQIADDGAISFTDGWMHIAVAGLAGVVPEELTPGVQNLADGIVIFKRADDNDDFVALPTYYHSPPALEGMLSANIGNSFSEFVLCSEDPSQTLPVELSSFTANETATGLVILQWTSETETNMLGYNVYRANSDNISEAANITTTIIPAANTSQTSRYIFQDENVTAGTTYFYWLQTMDLDLTTNFFGPVSVTLAQEEEEVPGLYITHLEKNYPNPFNPNTTIKYSLKENTNVQLRIYNAAGQLVRILEDGNLSAGSYQVNWDGTDNNGLSVTTGVYFYRLTTDHYDNIHKMVLVK